MNKQAERLELLAKLDQRFSTKGIYRRRARLWRSTFWVSIVRILAALRRFCDFVLAVIVLTLVSPLLATLFALSTSRGCSILRTRRLGRWATQFNQYSFDFSAKSRLGLFNGIPAVLNVLKGDMSFVGPRPISPEEALPSDRAAWKRYDIRPGCVSLWWIRKRANIAYRSEADLDAEYAETNSFWGDLGIAFRALPALAYGEGVSVAPAEISLFDIPIDNLTMSEATECIVALAQQPEPSQVCFVNADCVNIAFRRPGYKSVLLKAKVVLADGIGVRLAGRILNSHIRENVNGTDLLLYLCPALEKVELGLFLLGGLPGVAEAAAKWIKKHYPLVTISGCRHGYFTPDEETEVLGEIRASGAQILMVAFGIPKQDEWIATHLHEVGAKVTMGVGGLFDFYSGRIPRAPVWMRELGMEWFYRFLQEPGRMWKRYFLGNAVFLYRVIRHRALHEAKTRGAAPR